MYDFEELDMTEKIKQLEVQLEEITHCVSFWEEKWNEKYNEICLEAGLCPHCNNFHYPHCTTADNK